MNYEEKTWIVISQLYELSKITSTDENIKIEPKNCKIEPRLFQPIISKLQKDYKVIKLFSRYTTELSFGQLNDLSAKTEAIYNNNGVLINYHFEEHETDGYELKLLPEFYEFYKTIKKKFVNQPAQNQTKQDTIIYKLEFNQNTLQLTINNVLISTPTFDNDSHRFIEYMINNENKTIKTKTLINEAKLDHNKKITNIVNDLGFKGKSRNLFFKISKKSIKFTNPITQKILDESKIDQLSLLDFKK